MKFYSNYRNKLGPSESKILKFDLISTPTVIGKTTSPVSLFNYHPTELRMMLVYGTDLEHSQKGIFTTYFEYKSNQATFAFFYGFPVILLVIRRILRLRHDGYISCVIDIAVGFLGGGNIRITHWIEKWFFSVIWIAAFFLNAIYFTLVFGTVWTNFNDIGKSVGDIAMLNTPIYLSPDLEENEQSINVILRFDIYLQFFTFNFLNLSYLYNKSFS